MNIRIDQLAPEGSRESFTTYRVFLLHFARILKGKDKRQTLILTRLFDDQRAFLSKTKSLTLSDQERARIQKLLFNAWNSEMVARLNSTFDQALLTVTNQWKPIQAYYALYFLLTPIRMIKAPDGFDTIDTHEKTLTFATHDLWASLPMPWRCRYHVEQHRWYGFPIPPEPRAKRGWNFELYVDPYENFAQFLRTTGDHKREEKWEKLKSRRLKSGEKRRKKKSILLNYVSFCDALWRFRRWANYLQAQALLEGQEEEPAKEFDSNLNLVLMCSMAVLERVLSAHLGSEFMRRAYDDYLKIGHSVAPELMKHLKVRRDLVCA